ncbi:MAG: histidine phosphatase family protein [Rhodobiaceae bacterium]|nr:histidine phosphatase family protein [Rhodobiaceae bacterium]
MPVILRYLTHPQVRIDPAVPVPQWGLSDVGRARIEAACHAPAFAATTAIVSSAEVKAVETGAVIADALGILPAARERMHENDRSATGFLEPAEFEQVADAFFANPEESVRGWETAAAAQARIVAETQAVIASHEGSGDILLVGHGGVGTLLYCHFAGLAIDRSHDQPAGGGNVFAVDPESGAILHGWTPLEAL